MVLVGDVRRTSSLCRIRGRDEVEGVVRKERYLRLSTAAPRAEDLAVLGCEQNVSAGRVSSMPVEKECAQL